MSSTSRQMELAGRPLRDLEVPGIAAANLFKAAWALVVVCEAGTRDVVFAEVLADRYSPPIDVDQERVRGPCVNTNPVRAKLDAGMAPVEVAARFKVAGAVSRRRAVWLSGSSRVVGNAEFDPEDAIKARMMPPAADPPSRSSALWAIARLTEDELVVTLNFSSAAFDEEKVHGFAVQAKDLLERRPTDIAS
ncbi:D-lysergyl-peptide-synthetase subunit 1 [Colletotrichum orbiculare MAFF 240422]|uniref:D-lysergyl-peptide-synthetase subunit 1 n=1 Tax=Colletotrichum orbiculare (strain 104-T / ATCC 96160 / CBS 514.97 / LARS 414 / MAFF 240422) TaxID=1213857 RepID=A0A484F8E7_COLOR|nr:D-lysergyl-peptide-synthetase subunit 1 [Colletotrichum orbiculare MAFF 240422]